MKLALLLSKISAIILSVCIAETAASQTIPHILVGTYTNNGSFGIYDFTFNTINNQSRLVDSVQFSNPSFLAFAGGDKLVAVSEKKIGRVGLFEWNRWSGYKFINAVSSMGSHPCYVSTNYGNAYVANYTGGNFVVLPITENGLEKATQHFDYVGSGPDTVRQRYSHAHMAKATKDGKYVLVTNLGTDEIKVYAVDAATKEVKLFSSIKTIAGAGPRHLDFSPGEKFVYLMEELSGFVSVYTFAEGTLTPIQRIPALPNFDNGKPDGADIHVSPDGKHLYCTTRGNYNAISTFAVDSATGKLTYITHQSVMGLGPRNFMISPYGHNLLIANQRSNEIVCFYRNKETGELTDTGQRIAVKSPTCILWAY